MTQQALPDRFRSFLAQLQQYVPQNGRAETYDEIMARYRKEAAEAKPDRPMGIHGGKFGEAARGAMDSMIAVGDEIPGTITNYGESREQGMEILKEFLRNKFGLGVQ
jgi:hypothetical protein